MVLRFAGLIAAVASAACANPPEKAERPTPDSRLEWASELGGASVDDCDDVAVDGTGLLVLACHSDSSDFPGSNPVQGASAGMDAYVVKVDQTTGKVLWATRIGGSKYDGAFRIRLDEGGAAWLAGYTESSDFPVTAGAAQRRFGGGESDGFIAKVDSAGQVVYASYVGGSGSDQAIDLAIESENSSVHVIGMTTSRDLPAAKNQPS